MWYVEQVVSDTSSGEEIFPMQNLKPLTWPGLIALFGVPTLLNLVACRLAIPFLDARHILPIEVSYFISVGLLVLAPMFFCAIFLSAKDAGSNHFADILARMRVKKLTLTDTIWTIAGFVLLSFASFIIADMVLPRFHIDPNPFFFQNMPLTGHYFWILAVWPLFFFFNIFGEEFLWRGYIQPRQELLTGRATWLVHGLLWAAWHLPMGLDLIFSALPIFFILPAIVQLRKNTTIAIVIHFVFGAFGFLALALGLVKV
jgi:membrane protease YdiL (CAAX protease family)